MGGLCEGERPQTLGSDSFLTGEGHTLCWDCEHDRRSFQERGERAVTIHALENRPEVHKLSHCPLHVRIEELVQLFWTYTDSICVCVCACVCPGVCSGTID